MLTRPGESIGAVAPSEEEAALAKESSERLSQLLEVAQEFRIQSRGAGKKGNAVVIPASAVRLLADVLAQMAQGNAVTLTPVHTELTTQQAADLLNVSRPFLVRMLEQGRLPFRKVGKHRRIRVSDVLMLKHRSDAERQTALERLVAEGQELHMGY